MFFPIEPVVAGLLTSFVVCVVLVLTQSHHGHFSLDSTIGVQKVHANPTPRVGGVAIAAGLFVATFWISSNLQVLWLPLLLAAAPAFIMGLWEDLSKRVPISTRLLATMASGLLACWLTGMVLPRVNVPVVDLLFTYWPIAVLFSAFAVSGAANAVNIIDGFNGLSGGAVIISAAALGVLAYHTGDLAMVEVAAVVVAVTLGFLIVNFPMGKIFLGDGGAYTLGFLLGWMAIMLPARNAEVSVWATLLACAYPILETLFSIVRRRRRARSPGAADRLHLHSLVSSRLVAKWWPKASPLAKNSATGALMWIVALVPAVLAVQWPTQSGVLALSLALCALAYSAVYARLTQFRWCINPATLVLSHKAV